MFKKRNELTFLLIVYNQQFHSKDLQIRKFQNAITTS
jgi:hypothetical protein